MLNNPQSKKQIITGLVILNNPLLFYPHAWLIVRAQDVFLKEIIESCIYQQDVDVISTQTFITVYESFGSQ